MSAVAIVLIVLAAIVLLLFVGGYVANARRRADDAAALHARVREADQHLAAAHAEDKGWERGGLEAAARSAFAERHGAEPADLQLVLVVDRPGTDEDEAVFRGDGREIVLGRRDGAWVAR